MTKWFIQDEVVYTGRKNRFAPTLQHSANVAVAAIVSNLQGCKCFENLETKLWTKIPTSALMQMKGNLSQIYPIPLLSKKRNCISENLFANLFFRFEQNLHNICQATKNFALLFKCVFLRQCLKTLQ